jgi:hypothetical protein
VRCTGSTELYQVALAYFFDGQHLTNHPWYPYVHQVNTVSLCEFIEHGQRDQIERNFAIWEECT